MLNDPILQDRVSVPSAPPATHPESGERRVVVSLGGKVS